MIGDVVLLVGCRSYMSYLSCTSCMNSMSGDAVSRAALPSAGR